MCVTNLLTSLLVTNLIIVLIYLDRLFFALIFKLDTEEQ